MKIFNFRPLITSLLQNKTTSKHLLEAVFRSFFVRKLVAFFPRFVGAEWFGFVAVAVRNNFYGHVAAVLRESV